MSSASSTSNSTSAAAAFKFLDLDGEILCHVLNLFGYAEARKQHQEGWFDTEFGRFRIDSGSDEVVYEQADRTAICQERDPFGAVGTLMEPGTIIAKHYYNALYSGFGTSDTTLAWPDPTINLRERLNALYTNVTRVSQWPLYHDLKGFQYVTDLKAWSMVPAEVRGPEPCLPDLRSQEPLLLTTEWLDGANRIRRRATTNAGTDLSFKKEVLGLCEKALQQTSTDPAHVHRTKSLALEKTKKMVAIYFMQDANEHTFKPSRPGRHPSRQDEPTSMAQRTFHQSLQKVLASYITEPEGSWKRELYEARYELEKMRDQGPEIEYNSNVVYILPFTPASTLWDTKVLLTDMPAGLDWGYKKTANALARIFK